MENIKQSNICIPGVSKGREIENGAAKYFRKQWLKTYKFGEKYELADIYARSTKRTIPRHIIDLLLKSRITGKKKKSLK